MLFILRAISVAGMCPANWFYLLPTWCVLMVEQLTSLECAGVRNKLQGLQAAMAWERAAVTW